MQTQLELQKQESIRLKELDAFKTRLYTNITHEFRTPLTVILGLVDQMMINFHDRAETKMKDSVEIVRRNGRNLLHLINQVLDLSRLEANKMELHQAHGDILNYVQYIVESFLSHAESKNIYLAFYSELPDLQMDYDPERILQIVSNLLSNAIKFTPPSGKVIVRLYKEIENGKPLLIHNVKDTGSGIAKKDLPYIFDRFYQIEGSSESATSPGTGIGLALTKSIVEKHHGEICLDSQLGKGSVFTVKLPLGDARYIHDEHVHFADREKESDLKETDEDSRVGICAVANEESFQSEEGESKKYTVLVVEDNDELIQVLCELFSPFYQVIMASNGKEGLDKAYEYKPQIASNLKFIQVPHHGSRRNVSPTVLDNLLGEKGQEEKNKTAFISAGKESTTHPRQSAVNAFIRRGCSVVTTKGSTKQHYSGTPEREGWSKAEPLKFQDRFQE